MSRDYRRVTSVLTFCKKNALRVEAGAGGLGAAGLSRKILSDWQVMIGGRRGDQATPSKLESRHVPVSGPGRGPAGDSTAGAGH